MQTRATIFSIWTNNSSSIQDRQSLRCQFEQILAEIPSCCAQFQTSKLRRSHGPPRTAVRSTHCHARSSTRAWSLDDVTCLDHSRMHCTRVLRLIALQSHIRQVNHHQFISINCTRNVLFAHLPHDAWCCVCKTRHCLDLA